MSAGSVSANFWSSVLRGFFWYMVLDFPKIKWLNLPNRQKFGLIQLRQKLASFQYMPKIWPHFNIRQKFGLTSISAKNLASFQSPPKIWPLFNFGSEAGIFFLIAGRLNVLSRAQNVVFCSEKNHPIDEFLLFKNVNWMCWLRDILKICDFNENYQWKWFKIGSGTF